MVVSINLHKAIKEHNFGKKISYSKKPNKIINNKVILLHKNKSDFVAQINDF